jgi:hypothetical protein
MGDLIPNNDLNLHQPPAPPGDDPDMIGAGPQNHPNNLHPLLHHDGTAGGGPLMMMQNNYFPSLLAAQRDSTTTSSQSLRWSRVHLSTDSTIPPPRSGAASVVVVSRWSAESVHLRDPWRSLFSFSCFLFAIPSLSLFISSSKSHTLTLLFIGWKVVHVWWIWRRHRTP